MSNNTFQMTMLFDFFGDLLTDKQREYFDLYHNEDLSLSEIAEMAGISRQGVYDIISRSEKLLEEFEAKTGVVQRWLETRQELEQAETLARKLQQLFCNNPQSTKLAQELVETLVKLSETK